MNETIKKEWFLDRYCNQQFAALVEDGKLTEFDCETEPRSTCVGNIYKGVVTNVLSGMNAAFVSCGLEKNCYLSMDETYAEHTKYDGAMGITNDKTLHLSVGDEVIVQVVNHPRGNKGAKVTTHLSFVGKLVIYMPNTDFLGISRKITDEPIRQALLEKTDKMRQRPSEGFIVRTQAPFATDTQIKAEITYLKHLYEDMQTLSQTAPVGALLYEDDDLPARVMRDSYGEDIHAIYVGNRELYARLLRLIKIRKDIPEEKLFLYTGERAMLQAYGISPLVYEAASPYVPLQNGGSLVIEPTEAMTVVDVNTGSYVGDTDLEETVFAVNLVAADEIARQVRLRNIGGIVVVDFIDMTNEAHKEAVTQRLRERLDLDKAKCNVLPMSDLCITQFTRKRLGHDARSYLVKPCPHCQGMAYVHEDIFVVTQLRSAIFDCFADGHSVVVADLNEVIMNKIFSEALYDVELKTRWADKKIYFIPHKTYREDFFTVRGEENEPSVLPENARILQSLL